MCLFQFWFPQCVCPAVGLLGRMAVFYSVFLLPVLYTLSAVNSLSHTSYFYSSGYNASVLLCYMSAMHMGTLGGGGPCQSQFHVPLTDFLPWSSPGAPKVQITPGGFPHPLNEACPLYVHIWFLLSRLISPYLLGFLHLIFCLSAQAAEHF